MSRLGVVPPAPSACTDQVAVVLGDAVQPQPQIEVPFPAWMPERNELTRVVQVDLELFSPLDYVAFDE